MIFNYRYLTWFILQSGLLELPGDLLEIGSLLGDGTRQISDLLTTRHAKKKLYAVDLLRSDSDVSANSCGGVMRNIYDGCVYQAGHESLEEAFRRNTRDCDNVVLLREDSMTVAIPSRLCFAFIDGNHAREYVISDFEKAWAALVPGGAVCFDDYAHDLPPVTHAVNQCLARHLGEVGGLHFEPAHHFVAIFKKL